MSVVYRVTAAGEQRWAGSMAQVRELKTVLAEATGVKRSAVEHEEVEISFSKSGVLDFLNEHATACPSPISG